jgi:hypothetical protein
VVAWVDDIVTLLQDAEEQIEELKPLHDAALDDASVRGKFKARVKNVLEHERSALDFLAVGITNDFGTPKKGKIYYPLANHDADFPSTIGSKMPGVAVALPAVADAIRKHQPYQPHGEWLREFNRLTRQQKHNRLSVQIVKQTFGGRVTEKATGAYFTWEGLRFEPGTIHSDGGMTRFWSNPNRDPAAPKPFTIDPTRGVLVFGVPIDPATQRPYPDDRLISEAGPIDQWCFVNPHWPIIFALSDFYGGVVRVVKDVLTAAGL